MIYHLMANKTIFLVYILVYILYKILFGCNLKTIYLKTLNFVSNYTSHFHNFLSLSILF